MTAIEHIQSLSTTPWVMWMMLFMLFLFVMANIHQPRLMRTAFEMAFKRTDRVYNDAAVVGVSSIELRLFCLFSASMSWMIAMDNGLSFRFSRYLLIALCVLAWYLLRWGLREGIAWVGKLKHFSFPAGFMMCLSLCLTVVLFVINLGAMWSPSLWVWRIAMVMIVGLWLVMIGFKHFRCFVHDWKTFLGLMLYWSVVEVGSLVGLFFLIRVL